MVKEGTCKAAISLDGKEDSFHASLSLLSLPSAHVAATLCHADTKVKGKAKHVRRYI